MILLFKKLMKYRMKIRDLKRIEHMLLNLKDCCPDEKSLHECPIIETSDELEKKAEKYL